MATLGPFEVKKFWERLSSPIASPAAAEEEHTSFLRSAQEEESQQQQPYHDDDRIAQTIFDYDTCTNHQDGLLCTAPQPPHKRSATVIITSSLTTLTLWRALLALALGFYLAWCPLPKKHHLPYTPWLLLLALSASLTSLPPPRRSPTTYLSKLAIAHLGLLLFVYALFGAADEIHIDLLRQGWAWYGVSSTDGGAAGLKVGVKPGYLMRGMMVVLAGMVMRWTGLYSRRRIAVVWGLCLFWGYADVYLTLIDLARGREHW